MIARPNVYLVGVGVVGHIVCVTHRHRIAVDKLTRLEILSRNDRSLLACGDKRLIHRLFGQTSALSSVYMIVVALTGLIILTVIDCREGSRAARKIFRARKQYIVKRVYVSLFHFVDRRIELEILFVLCDRTSSQAIVYKVAHRLVKQHVVVRDDNYLIFLCNDRKLILRERGCRRAPLIAARISLQKLVLALYFVGISEYKSHPRKLLDLAYKEILRVDRRH